MTKLARDRAVGAVQLPQAHSHVSAAFLFLCVPRQFYWQEKGEAASITNAVSAIDTCLREPPGRAKCSKVQGEFDEEPSSRKVGKSLFFQ